MIKLTRNQRKQMRLAQERADAKRLIDFINNPIEFKKLIFINKLDKALEHLKICAGCSQLFVKVRDTKQFCSDSCRIKNCRNNKSS